MPTVVLDTIEGASGRQCYDGHGMKAWEFRRVAIVSGITDPPEGMDILAAAVQAVVGEVGDIGWGTYPNHPDAYIQEFQPEAIDQETVRVTILYKELLYSTAQIEVGTSLTQTESNRDAFGNEIVLNYTYPANYPIEEKRGKPADPQHGMYQRLVPETTVTFRRTEYQSPLVKSTQYTGKTNLNNFMGLPPGRWLCTGISGQSDDAGLTWKVVYEFQCRADGWDEQIVFINPDTGRPPEGLILGVGIKTPQRYLQIDFGGLQL